VIERLVPRQLGLAIIVIFVWGVILLKGFKIYILGVHPFDVNLVKFIAHKTQKGENKK